MNRPGVPIFLGPRSQPLDLRAWNLHCERTLGRQIEIIYKPNDDRLPKKLSSGDLASLGFVAAAGLRWQKVPIWFEKLNT